MDLDGECGFCDTGHHNLCPRVVRNANQEREDKKWQCACWAQNQVPHLEPGEEVPDDLWSIRPPKM